MLLFSSTSFVMIQHVVDELWFVFLQCLFMLLHFVCLHCGCFAWCLSNVVYQKWSHLFTILCKVGVRLFWKSACHLL